ncbi:MAG: DNA polymerase III subunit gamma and tau [Microbacteriaceae bacterium]|nr:DNA polymerase III subunit gamma and tau [Microbacteriaceae bacterium]
MVTALYRRYRPENFAEMIGQAQVTDPLMTALRTNRVNHAYLFSGPRGCGKTTSARILARCLNCAEGPTDTPCGKCPSCVELGRGGQGSLDVVEIDAASHNGVDDARDIRERAIFAPARDRYKIFILDEAHMVTPQGFNALLKIVEEPPEHVKFIFATTEPDKVIGTIRSRTHHYPFRLVPPAMMLDYVQKLVTEEGMSVAPGVLPLVVRAGGGSPRDTLSLLDQLIAGSEGDEIGYERAVALLGYTHSALLDEVVEALAAGDASTAFAAVDRVIQTGQDPRRFVEDLLERLRDLIIIAAAGPDRAAAVLRGTPADELERMGLEARAFGAAELSRVADIVNAALTEMSGATSPRLHLELMIARALVPTADDAGSMARVERLERRVGVTDAAPQRAGAPVPDGRVAAPPAAPRIETPTPAEPAPTAPSAAPATAGGWSTPGVTGWDAAPSLPPVVEAAKAAAPVSDGRVAAPPAAPRVATPAAAETPAATTPPAEPTVAAVPSGQPSAAQQRAASAPAQPPVGPVTLQQVKDAWPQILEAVKAAKMTAWVVVFTATVRKFEGDVLTLTFQSENDVASFRPQQGVAQNVSDVLRESIQKVLGVRVKFVAKTAADFAQSLKSDGFGVTPPASGPMTPLGGDAPKAPAAPAQTETQPRPATTPIVGEQPQAATRGVQPADAALGASAPAVPPAAPATPAAPVTSWAVVAIPDGGATAQSAESPAAEAQPEPKAAPPVTAGPAEASAPPVTTGWNVAAPAAVPAPAPTPAVAAAALADDNDGWAPAAPADDNDGWAEFAPSDDDAPPFEEDPDAGPRPQTPQVSAASAPSAAASSTGARPGAVAPGGTPSATRPVEQTEQATARPEAAAPAPTAPAAPASPAARKGPSFSSGEPQRYGEAVVREILNARFIEEQQLSDNGGR